MTKRLIVACLVLGTVQTTRAANIQYRPSMGISKQLTNEWKLVFSDGVRFRNSEHDLYYNQTDLGLIYSGLTPWLDISSSMKWATQEDDQGHWQQEVRPYLDATIKWQAAGLKLSDRSRLEYRQREADVDVWRFRNHIKAQFPWEWSRWRLKPYMADEVYFRLDGSGLFRNRTFGGVTMPIGKRLKGSLYYFWDNTKDDNSGEWTELNAFGVKLSCAF
jgi:hypothetical protein